MFGVLGIYNFFCRILIWELCPHLLLVKLLWMNTIQNQTSHTQMVLELMGEIMEGMIEKEVNFMVFLSHIFLRVEFILFYEKYILGHRKGKGGKGNQ